MGEAAHEEVWEPELRNTQPGSEVQEEGQHVVRRGGGGVEFYSIPCGIAQGQANMRSIEPCKPVPS